MEMIKIRHYKDEDSVTVGKLIAKTYKKYNLSFVSDGEIALFLGPFHYADSQNQKHQDEIARTIKSAMVFVAEMGEEIVGVLRGRKDRIASLFVKDGWQRMGIGRQLVRRFEGECARLGTKVIRVSSTMRGIPFYSAMGYKKSTGVRSSWSFEGKGLAVQPMRKVLTR